MLDELDWDPEVDATKIGITAADGVVTLTGIVRSFTDRWMAEKIAKRVTGVQGVANELHVALVDEDRRDDTDIAVSAINALEWNSRVPKDHVQIAVREGWLQLEGEVEWEFQRRAAEDAVRWLRGVRGVTNAILVNPHVSADDVKQKIETAIRRKAEIDANAIHVETADTTVTLTGKVRSFAEREDAVHAAWSAPGVTRVIDHIAIAA
ncbi:MAG TPA: BON domain-containing protein [Thermoanaerobaculia bacterium]|nr:BON domain-containing protein [Thermoanaerobaculia bacterium]